MAGRTHHLSSKLMFTVVKIIPLPTTIVTQIALKEKNRPDPFSILFVATLHSVKLSTQTIVEN